MNQERRQYMRYNIPMNVKFKRLIEKRTYSFGTILNFSRAGMCLLAGDSELKIDDEVELKVRLPQKKSTVSAVGSVVWKSYHDNQLVAGIRLIVMNRGIKFEILDHCYEMWCQKVLHIHYG